MSGQPGAVAQSPTGTRWIRPDSAGGLVLLVALLATINVCNNQIHGVSYLITRPVEIGALLAVAVWWGLRSADLGLAPGSLPRGLRRAGVQILIVVAVYSIAAATPAAGLVIVDADGDPWHALVGACEVLFGTVLLEEFAFRGVLWGMLDRRYGARVATIGSAALFGLWHVLPAMSTTGRNARVTAMVGGHLWITIALTVVVTALFGVLFAVLRRRSGSLLPAMALHWALNAAGFLIAAAAALV